ncbi:ATP-binding protein [Desulfobotulus mexicanus]|uniref:AAA family ATPase n=1 Tax=Desulfobotulus mexicanus TaxID=2586642 RepID=A0A5S5ME83_9BACT|nr:ATP-binding protein [Desulfobotulus mexicanus]TYT74033.1 AAA family ATPase [Desulfobotulus mexicanus]
MKKLPIGIQNFREIIENGYVYVDKTKDYHNLIQNKYCFLSRPRRFGKSLMLSTLKEIFKGEKKLFKGLWIENKIDWNIHPVIHLDFNLITHHLDIETFERTLLHALKSSALEYNISIDEEDPKNFFQQLVTALSKKAKVVLLVDEYDKAVIDYIDAPDKAGTNKDYIASFYEAIKGLDACFRFVMLTGVTKFSKVSVFSKLNNLRDITFTDTYSTMLGIREEELYANFEPHLKQSADALDIKDDELKSKIRTWYNGYSWNGRDKLYNPFSILSFFAESSFNNYWFETGTPTFLIELIRKNHFLLPDLEGIEVENYSFGSYGHDNLEPVPLLFQTGYLTIKEKKKGFSDEMLYRLGLPNREVKRSLLNNILGYYTGKGVSHAKPPYLKMLQSLASEDFESFIHFLTAAFASLPYNLYPAKEDYYHSIFYLILVMLGAEIDAEILTDKGRMDAAIHFSDKIYIVEFKTGDVKKGMQQIRNRRYWEKFGLRNKKILLLAVGGFDEKKIEYLIEHP